MAVKPGFMAVNTSRKIRTRKNPVKNRKKTRKKPYFFTYFTRNLPVIDILLFEEEYCVFKTFQHFSTGLVLVQPHSDLQSPRIYYFEAVRRKMLSNGWTDLLKLQLLKRSHIFQVWSSMHHVFAQPQTLFHVVICTWNLVFFLAGPVVSVLRSWPQWLLPALPLWVAIAGAARSLLTEARAWCPRRFKRR